MLQARGWRRLLPPLIFSLMQLMGACSRSESADGPTPGPTAAVTTAPVRETGLPDVAGIGLHDTDQFGASPGWSVGWRFDCANLAGGEEEERKKPTAEKDDEEHAPSGEFGLVVIGAGGTVYRDYAVKRDGKDGEGTARINHGGRFYLRVITDCSWHIHVSRR